MTKEAIITALEELAKTGRRSNTAMLRSIFDSVEDALESGSSREAVYAVLMERGFTFTLRGFDQAMYRLRQAKKVAKPAAPVKSEATPDQVSEPVEQSADREKKFNHYFQQSNPLKGSNK